LIQTVEAGFVSALARAPTQPDGTRILYAATHGRGAWRAEIPAPKKK
jgi:hypothetical protein